MKAVFEDPEDGSLYVWHCSSHKSALDPRRRCHARNGTGGVIVAVHKRWLPVTTVQRMHYDNEHLRSHLVAVKIQTPHSQPLRVCGVYMPFDAGHRAKIYHHLRTVKVGGHAIWAGDWNADPDRRTGGLSRRTVDLRHHRFVSTTEGMQLLLPDAGAPTHYPRTKGARASCLDHYLLSDSMQSLGASATILPTTEDSDHTQVLLTVADVSSMLVPPAPHREEERPRRLKAPANKEQLLELKQKVTAQLAAPAHRLKQALQQAEAAPETYTAQDLQKLGAEVHGSTIAALDLAYETLDHTPAGKQRRRRTPRKQAREIESLMVAEQAIRKCRDDYRAAKQCVTEERQRGRLVLARHACLSRLASGPARQSLNNEVPGPAPLPYRQTPACTMARRSGLHGPKLQKSGSRLPRRGVPG